MLHTSFKSTDLTEKPLTTLSGHRESIRGIAYLPGGERVVSCSDDMTIRIWDVEKGKQEGTSMVHEAWIYGLAVTRDGKRILSGGDDRRIKVWDVETHQPIEDWTSHRGRILCIALSLDDQLVASGDDDGEIVIWEMKESGKIKHSIHADHGVYSLCFSPNGEKLACGVGNFSGGVGEHVVKVYDVKSGKVVLGPMKGHKNRVRCVLWSLDGIQLFSASNDLTIRKWDPKRAESIGEPWTGHAHYIYSLSLSPDGTKLVSASIDQTVRFWDIHSGAANPIEHSLQHEDHVYAVAFSPCGKFVASGQYNGKLSIWCVPWWDYSQQLQVIITLAHLPTLCLNIRYALSSNILHSPPDSYLL
ncbi:WD40 repeat-like protein [Paxillus ammoniavirescens]|nr:WD40 repeat-like protein [Paxillus ammoniavirescens]